MGIYKKNGPVTPAELGTFLELPREHQIRLLKQIHGPAVCLDWIDWPENEIKRILLKPALKECI